MKLIIKDGTGGSTHCNLMWFAISFGLSLIIPANGILSSLFHGIFGRLYMFYWLVKYADIWMPWIKNVFLKCT